jgi:hypothetical protein
MHFLDIRMVVGVRQHARDHPALIGHFHTLIGAKLFDV